MAIDYQIFADWFAIECKRFEIPDPERDKHLPRYYEFLTHRIDSEQFITAADMLYAMQSGFPSAEQILRAAGVEDIPALPPASEPLPPVTSLDSTISTEAKECLRWGERESGGGLGRPLDMRSQADHTASHCERFREAIQHGEVGRAWGIYLGYMREHFPDLETAIKELAPDLDSITVRFALAKRSTLFKKLEPKP